MAKRKAKELKAIADLAACPYNPREIDADSAAGLRVSLSEFGDLSGIVWNRRTGHLVAGHQRMDALRTLYGDALKLRDGFIVTPAGEAFPVRVVDWPKGKADVAMVAANNPHIAGDFTVDLRGLTREMGDIFGDLCKKLRFDELEGDLPPGEPEAGLTDPDAVPEPPKEAVTKRGDLWLCGEHRLLCGDSTKAEDVARLMDGGGKAELCFTSPPYAQQRDYEGEAKELVKDWDGLMRGVFGNLPMADDGQVLVNLGLVHRDNEWVPYWDAWIEWMREQGWRRFGWYVWDKGYGLCGDWAGRCAPAHEFIFHLNRVAKKPAHCIPKKPESIGNRKLHTYRQKDGTLKPASSPDATSNTHKIPDSVWRLNHAITAPRVESAHPAVYPVALASTAMIAWPGCVFDPFLGSGTTMIAAEQLGRRCFGMEIEPRYVDVAVRRWEEFTGKKAVLERRSAPSSRPRG